jgi:cyclomaltodextrinase
MKQEPPKWAEQAMFYHIYPLGLLGAPKSNSFITPINRLGQLNHWIGHIKSMGLNALYIGPVFESSQHGYDTVDYYNVDRRLGTNHDMKEFSEALREAGIKLVLDAVFHHVGRNFWAFRDVQLHGEKSNFRDWFSGIDFNRKSTFGDDFAYDGWNGHYDLVKLNLKNADVKNHLFGAVSFWITEFGIDGLRLDVAESIDTDFLAELTIFCKDRNPQFWLMGEMVHGDYKRLTEAGNLDSVTNYELYKGLYSSHNDHNYFEIAYTLNRQFGESGIYRDQHLYNFADNHDVTRAASILNDTHHLFPLYLLLFTMPGIPSMYYGSEWATKGSRTADEDGMLRPQINIISDSQAPEIYHFICQLVDVRKKCQPLWNGSYRQIYVAHEVFIFYRKYKSEVILIAVNASNSNIDLSIAFDEPGIYQDLLSNGYTNLVKERKTLSLNIPACGGRILERTQNDNV